MIYKIELYLGRIASLAIFLWAYWQQIYLKCWYRATVFPDKRLKNRAALAVTTEIQPHQELPVWGCWLDVLWQKIFDICYCRYSDFENLAAASTTNDIQDLGVCGFCVSAVLAALLHWAWTWAFSRACVDLYLPFLWLFHSQFNQWKWWCVVEVVSITLSCCCGYEGQNQVVLIWGKASEYCNTIFVPASLLIRDKIISSHFEVLFVLHASRSLYRKELQ